MARAVSRRAAPWRSLGPPARCARGGPARGGQTIATSAAALDSGRGSSFPHAGHRGHRRRRGRALRRDVLAGAGRWHGVIGRAESWATITVRDDRRDGPQARHRLHQLAGDSTLDLAPRRAPSRPRRVRCCHIGAVTHRLDGVMRTSVLEGARRDVAGGRLIAAFGEAVVRRITRRLDYTRVYSATVVQQRLRAPGPAPQDPRRPAVPTCLSHAPRAHRGRSPRARWCRLPARTRTRRPWWCSGNPRRWRRAGQ